MNLPEIIGWAVIGIAGLFVAVMIGRIAVYVLGVWVDDVRKWWREYKDG